MAEPLDNKIIRHFLKFADGLAEITEPTKFDAASFVQQQGQNRYGRDVSFSPENMSFSPNMFVNGLTHEFEKLIVEHQTNGFEANVQYWLGIQNENSEVITYYIIGNLDFYEAETDEVTYFDCKIIQENKQAVVRRREDLKVNLFSDIDAEGDAITPLLPVDLLLQATPIVQTSTWEAVGNWSETLLLTQQYAISLIPVITQSQIEDTLSPNYGSFLLTDTDDVAEMLVLDAQNNLTKLTLELSGFTYDFDDASNVDLYWEIGETYEGLLGTNTNDTVALPATGTDEALTVSLPNITRGQKLWLFLIVANNGTTAVSLTSGDISITTTSIAFSSVIKALRLYDVMQYVVKSISGLPIDAPRFLNQFVGQYVTTGKLIRNLTNEAFNISFKDILGYLPEVRGDYEITDTGVFIGLFEDFYNEFKVHSFKAPATKSFKIGFNPEYATNQFDWKYKKYETENDEDKSREGVHTESQLQLPNDMVENAKKIQVGFIRDAFLLEKTRKDAIQVTDETATREDEDVFIIDTVEKYIVFTEAFYLQHVIIEAGVILRILNDGSVNFLFLGIIVNQFITITGANAGDYLVTNIQKGFMELTATGPADPQTPGYELTDITYTAEATNLTNRTNEGFDLISGTSNPAGMSNLNFTQKRNILNYYGKYILTACLFKPEENVRVIKYIHNGGLITQKADDPGPITEDGEIILNDLKIQGDTNITPYLITENVLAEFETFWGIREKLRTTGKRGYIEIINALGETINIFPKKLAYIWATNELEITGEKRKEPFTREFGPDDVLPKDVETDNYIFEDDDNYIFEDGDNYVFD